MRRTTILADEQLLVEARYLAERQGRTFTDLVQEALREYIRAHRAPRQLSIIGIARSNEPNVARRDEEILAAEVDPIEGWSPRRQLAGGAPGRGAARARR
jgi:hypothetical protein